MTILHIVSSIDPALGGVSQVIRDNVPALQKMGVVCEVLSFDDPSASFLSEDTFNVHAIGPAKGPYAFVSGLQTWLTANMSRYDVLIIHGLWLYNAYGTFNVWNKKAYSSQEKSPKLFVMPHGMLDPYFQKAEGRKLKALRNTVFWKLFEHKTVNGCDGLLFTCEEEKLLARQPFKPYHPKRELNVGLGTTPPPPADPSFITSFISAYPKLANKKYWLFLSRIHPKKGVDLLLRGYKKLLTEDENIPNLVVAGPGLETEYGKAMTALASHPKIHFPGMLSGHKKWGAFYGCEAFVLPSHQENFGIAVAEAMACKKPVLISNQVNIWREIKEGGGGLVQADTKEGTLSLLKAFQELSENEKEQMSEKAYLTYKHHFSIEMAAQKMLEQLNLVLENKA
ncbi:MAG: glycosyltransferase [Leeuwenhoekiella sp.]